MLSVGQENYGDSAENISQGIQNICSFIRSKQPQAFLVLLVRIGIFLSADINHLWQTLLPRGGPESPLRERNRVVNSLLGDYVKGNSRVQLVNIDTGFEQVRRIHNHKHRWNLLATNFVHCAQVQKKPIMPAVSSQNLQFLQLWSQLYIYLWSGWWQHISSRHVWLCQPHSEGLQQSIRASGWVVDHLAPGDGGGGGEDRGGGGRRLDEDHDQWLVT